MSGINYAYYVSSVGYKIVGKTDSDIILAGGGTIPSNTYATATEVVPYTGATTNIDINTKTLISNGITFGYGSTNKGFSSATPFAFLNTTSAQQIYTGGILSSNVYSDSTKIPTNGIYSKGNILTGGTIAKEGGLSTQFLKADGSIDTTSYAGHDKSTENGIVTYSFNNGMLVKTNIPATLSTMVELSVKGFNYGDTNAIIDSIIVGYSWTGNANAIHVPQGLNKSQTISVDMFIYENNVCFWVTPIATGVPSKTIRFTLLTTDKTHIITSVTNEVKPTTGITKDTVVPFKNSWTTNNLVNPITGSGTTNYIPKFTAGTVLGNSLIFDNGTNLGIGVINPQEKLDIIGNFILRGSGSNGSNIFKLGTYSPNGLYGSYIATDHNYSTTVNTNLRLGVSNGGVPLDALNINYLGNVGIGPTTPITKLHVDKTSQTIGTTIPSGGLVITNLGGSNYALEFGTDTTKSPWIQSRNATSSTYYNLLLNPSGGNVGIGTETPNSKLDVVGDVTTRGLIINPTDIYGGTWLNLNSGYGNYYFKSDGSGAYAGLVIKAGENNAVKVQTNGNILVNTVNDNGSGAKLQVNGNTTATSFISTAVTGTSPLAVSSTTKVDNLNADLLDGKHASEFVTQTQMGTIQKAEFTYNGGVQEFLLPNDFYQVFTIDVQGQGALHSSQYTITAPNKVTIVDTLQVGDYVVVLYGTGNLAGVPYYTQAETDALISSIQGNQTVEINSSQSITTNKTYRVNASAGNVTLTLINPTSHQDITIKKIDSSTNSVFIKSLQLIDGDDTIELSEQYEKVNLKWCGSTYDII